LEDQILEQEERKEEEEGDYDYERTYDERTYEDGDIMGDIEMVYGKDETLKMMNRRKEARKVTFQTNNGNQFIFQKDMD
jgi:hypothetical protein